MGYQSNIVVDLSEDFGEGCNATIRDPRCVLRLKDLTMPDVEGLTEEQRAALLTERMHDVLRRLIVAWNVWDIETGEPLPVPRADPAALNPDRCPEFIAVVLSRKVNELMRPFALKHLRAQGETPASAASTTTETSAEPSSSSDAPSTPAYALEP